MSNIAFIAYAEDCVISGHVALEADRLTDLLTDQAEYEVRNLTLQHLEAPKQTVVRSVTVLREELCLVAGTGPRGDARRRVRTRPRAMRARVGPYDVFGYLHAMPTADPIAVAMRRPIIPVTAGWVWYTRGTETVERHHDAMLLNRDKIEWLEPATDDEIPAQLVPHAPTVVDSRARDMTGELFVW
jgi:hypothetical protein